MVGDVLGSAPGAASFIGYISYRDRRMIAVIGVSRRRIAESGRANNEVLQAEFSAYCGVLFFGGT
jgi:hypothetical protein